MLVANQQTDPIVEILRLAYRRGLAIRQQQVNKGDVADNQPVKTHELNAEQLDSQIEAKP